MQKLDVHNIRILSGVLAQSVSLLHYEARADEVLRTFRLLNESVLRGGAADDQIAARLRTRELHGELIGGAGARAASWPRRRCSTSSRPTTRSSPTCCRSSRSSTAPTLSSGTTPSTTASAAPPDEYELEELFQSLEDKLGIVQENARFFVEVSRTGTGIG